MNTYNQNAKVWLRMNGFEETADIIQQIEDEWAVAGRKTRRNWWDVLSGTLSGKPRTADYQPYLNFLNCVVWMLCQLWIFLLSIESLIFMLTRRYHTPRILGTFFS